MFRSKPHSLLLFNFFCKSLILLVKFAPTNAQSLINANLRWKSPKIRHLKQYIHSIVYVSTNPFLDTVCPSNAIRPPLLHHHVFTPLYSNKKPDLVFQRRLFSRLFEVKLLGSYGNIVERIVFFGTKEMRRFFELYKCGILCVPISVGFYVLFLTC